MVSIDILPFLKEGDSYDVAKSAIVSAGTFDPCELFTSFAKHSCREYCLWELALRNRDILAHRHEHNLTCRRFKGKGHANSVLKNEVCACPYGSTDYPSGHLESIIRYKNGILNGDVNIYADKDKGLIENRKYENGQLIDRTIHQSRYLEPKSIQAKK